MHPKNVYDLFRRMASGMSDEDLKVLKAEVSKELETRLEKKVKGVYEKPLASEIAMFSKPGKLIFAIESYAKRHNVQLSDAAEVFKYYCSAGEMIRTA